MDYEQASIRPLYTDVTLAISFRTKIEIHGMYGSVSKSKVLLSKHTLQLSFSSEYFVNNSKIKQFPCVDV